MPVTHEGGDLSKKRDRIERLPVALACSGGGLETGEGGDGSLVFGSAPSVLIFNGGL